LASVLIVDDQPGRYEALLERLVPGVLGNAGAEFSGCIRDALVKLKHKTFDVLVVDMLLPETPWGRPLDDGGAKLLEYLEEDDELRRPKYIVGITAAVEQCAAVSTMFNTQPWVLLRTAGGGNPWEEKLEGLIRHVMSLEAAQSATEYKTDLCVLTALRSPEFEALSQVGFELPELSPVDSATFAQRGTLDASGRALSVVAACCLRMGAVESALLAAKMIEKFRPRILALAGICAGYEDKVQYGDVIVANPCWDYMSRKITTDAKGVTTFTNLPDYINIDLDRTALSCSRSIPSGMATRHAPRRPYTSGLPRRVRPSSPTRRSSRPSGESRTVRRSAWRWRPTASTVPLAWRVGHVPWCSVPRRSATTEACSRTTSTRSTRPSRVRQLFSSSQDASAQN
jgi:CheY-like chemotaxis protein